MKLFIVAVLLFLTGCAELPVRGSFTDIAGVERVTEKQCLVGIITPNVCRSVAHKRNGDGYYMETSDTVTESAGFLQQAGTSAVTGVVGAELFDDKGGQVNNTNQQAQGQLQFQGQKQKQRGGKRGWH